jgi:hypothetical protein
MIWQPLAWSGWHNQWPGIASAYLLFIRRVKQCSRQSRWCNELPDINQLVAFQFLQGSCNICTCPKYCIQLFLGRSSARMQRNCVKSADNFCYVGGEVTFFWFYRTTNFYLFLALEIKYASITDFGTLNMKIVMKSLDWLQFRRKVTEFMLYVSYTLYPLCSVYWLTCLD